MYICQRRGRGVKGRTLRIFYFFICCHYEKKYLDNLSAGIFDDLLLYLPIVKALLIQKLGVGKKNSNSIKKRTIVLSNIKL